MPTGPQKPIEVIARGILSRNGRILLCRSVPAGYFYLPGGHVEPGEAASEALVREFDEETGLAVAPGRCCLITEGRFFDGDVHRHEYNVVFHVEHAGAPLPEQIPSREKRIAFEWVDLAELPDLDLRPRSIRAWLVAGEEGDADHPEWISDRE